MEFKPNNDMIQAAKAVFVTMAMVETIKPIVKGYQNAILAKHQFPVAQEWSDRVKGDVKTITDPEQAYLMEDADFQIYLAETFEARDRANLKVDNPDFCPLLVAEDLQCKAQRVLVETMEPITHLSPDDIFCSSNGLENYRKLVDLSLKLLAPFVGNAEDILRD